MKQQSPRPNAHEKSQPLIEWEILDKAHSSSNLPKSRFKHQAFIYQKAVYVYGGTTIPFNEPFDDPLDIYRFNCEQTQWQKIRLKCNSKDLEVVSGHCGVLNGNRWFMFGGTNNDFKSNNYLWRLNLQTFELTKLQSKGEIPSARDSASLFYIQKNWLLLYGGVNVNTVQIFNTFHFYNIDSKQWTKCQGSYQYQVYSRFDPAMTELNGKFYMFGGNYRNRQSQELYLNDFYELEISLPLNKLNSKVSFKRLNSPLMPEPRSGHSITAIGDKYLFLLGGQNSQTKMKDGIKFDDATIVNNAWIYNIQINNWRKVVVKNGNRFKYRSQFSISFFQTSKFILFGGINSYSNVSNELVELKLQNFEFKAQQNQLPPCVKCEQKRNFIQRTHYISAQTIQDIADNIDFPFAAFGLLIDNGINHGASFVNLFYHNDFGKQKQRYFRVQDNGKLPWSEQEFFNSMASFSAGPTSIPASTDKKIKMGILREILRMEYGSNCKVASLRLGTGFLHISYSQNGELIRVSLFKKQEDDRKKDRYVLLSYTFSAATKESTRTQMNVPRKYIQSRFSELIEDALSQYNVRNTLFIIQPKIQDFKANNDEQLQLKVNYSNNDIINGSIASFVALQKAGYNISDCVDVSLKAYITCLYLKNESTLIALSVKNIDPVSIPTQSYLQKVDKLCKHKHVLQLNNMIEFQFKIVELYYLYDLKKKLNYFNNGLLIYHKNRLISRFKYQFGELIPRKIYKMEGNCNLIRMFGFIQIPDHVPVNIFKTKIIHPLMTEKLFARLKFVNKMFKKELLKMIADNNHKRLAPTKLSAEEKEQDIKENPEFKFEPEAITKQKQRRVQKEKGEDGRFKKKDMDQNIMNQVENQNSNQAASPRKQQMQDLIQGIPIARNHPIFETVNNKNLLQEQCEMKEALAQVNYNCMQDEEMSQSSSESEGRARGQIVEQQEVQIRHFGIDQVDIDDQQQQQFQNNGKGIPHKANDKNSQNMSQERQQPLKMKGKSENGSNGFNLNKKDKSQNVISHQNAKIHQAIDANVKAGYLQLKKNHDL